MTDLFDWADREADRQPSEDTDITASETQESAAAPATAPVALPRPDVAVTTLAEALAYALAQPGIPGPQKTRWRTAVATLCRFSGKEASAILIAPPVLSPLLASILPGRFRVSAKRWSNTCSDLRTLARLVGAHVSLDEQYATVTGAWEALLDTLPRAPQKANFRGFARYCQANGIMPSDVTSETLENYRVWREHHIYDLNPRLATNGARRIWNQNAGRTPGWPSQPIKALNDPRVMARSLTEFGPNFGCGVAAYIEMLRNPDPFSPGAGRPLSEVTCNYRRQQLIWAASLIVKKTDRDPASIDGLDVLANTDMMKMILLHMYAVAGGRWSIKATQVAALLFDVARRWVKVPEEVLKPLEDMRAVVKVPRQAIGGRALSRLEQFDDTAVLKHFFRLPREFFDAADKLKADGRTKRAAVLHERALVLAILQTQPMRRRTLLELDIEKHFRRDKKGRITMLSVPGELTKNGAEISVPLPEDLSRRIEKHIRVYRPVLCQGSPGTFLFPARAPGRHLSAEYLARSVSKLVRNALGQQFNMHLVRHIAAMMLFDSNPNAGPVAQRLLGHRQLATTESYYGRIKTRGAQRAWSGMVDGLRTKERKAKARKGKAGSKGRKSGTGEDA